MTTWFLHVHRFHVSCSFRKQFPASPSLPKIPSWQIPLNNSSKAGSTSNPASTNHTNSSSDISPVSNESGGSSPLKDVRSPQEEEEETGVPVSHSVNGDLCSALDLKDQGEKDKTAEEPEQEEEERVEEEEEEDLSLQAEDRKGGDGQFNEQVEKLRRPEGSSNESEVD